MPLKCRAEETGISELPFHSFCRWTTLSGRRPHVADRPRPFWAQRDRFVAIFGDLTPCILFYHSLFDPVVPLLLRKRQRKLNWLP